MENNTKSFDTFLRETIDFYLSCFRFTLQSIKRYWLLFLLVILGVLALWGKSLLPHKTIYSGKVVFEYNYLDKRLYGELFEQLQNKIEDGNFEGLKNSLNVSKEIAESILEIKAYNFQGNELVLVNEKVLGPVVVKLKLLNPNHVREIEAGLLYYVNNYPFVMKTISEYRTDTKSKIAFIEKELSLLDSLKMNANIGEKNNQAELAGLFELTEKKFTERAALVNTLNKVDAFEVFANLVVTKNFADRSMKKKLMYSLILVFFGVLLCVGINWYKNPDAIEK